MNDFEAKMNHAEAEVKQLEAQMKQPLALGRTSSTSPRVLWQNAALVERWCDYLRSQFQFSEKKTNKLIKNLKKTDKLNFNWSAFWFSESQNLKQILDLNSLEPFFSTSRFGLSKKLDNLGQFRTGKKIAGLLVCSAANKSRARNSWTWPSHSLDGQWTKNHIGKPVF